MPGTAINVLTISKKRIFQSINLKFQLLYIYFFFVILFGRIHSLIYGILDCLDGLGDPIIFANASWKIINPFDYCYSAVVSTEDSNSL